MDKIKNEVSLLQKLTEMGNLMYWKFFPLTRRWEFSELFLRAVSLPFGEGELPFRKYVEVIDEPCRVGMMELLEPTDDYEDGTLFYAIQLDGKNRFHKCNYSKFVENGEEGMVGLITDVTSEQREMRRNKKIIDAMPNFIFIIDDQYHIRDVMKSESVKLLHTTAELIDTYIGEIYSPQVTELFKEAIRNCIRTRTLQEIAYPLHVEGEDYYFNLRMVPYEDNEVLAFIHEITNRVQFSNDIIKVRKTVEEETVRKSNFLMDLSHEIRTLLNLITVFTELMVQTNKQEERESYMKFVRDGNEQLLALIGDVLDLSRIEQGKVKMNRVAFDLSGFLRELTQPCIRKTEKRHTLRLDIPGELKIVADRGHVMQIFSNLLSNAKDSMEEGTITIRIREKEGVAECAVIDNGKGIPINKQSMIFERFYRTEEGGEGSGLGLPICKKLVNAMGGEISLRSEEGKGSTVLFTLPTYYTEGDVSPLSDKDTKKAVYVLTKDGNTFMLLNEVLQDDFVVHWISDSNIFFSKSQQVPPSLIIVNQEGTLKYSCDFLAEARNVGIRVPIIVTLPCEAAYEKQAYLKLLDSGATDLMESPFTKFGLLRLAKGVTD